MYFYGQLALYTTLTAQNATIIFLQCTSICTSKPFVFANHDVSSL